MERMRDHVGILHKVCSVYARSKPDHDDLYQDIVLQLWRSYPSFRGTSRFSTWMYRVALNVAMTRVRRRELLDFHAGQELDRFPASSPNPETAQQMQTVQRAIRSLKPVDRAIVLMWLDDLSYREIGECLGLSEKNVGVRLSRIKKRLAESSPGDEHDGH